MREVSRVIPLKNYFEEILFRVSNGDTQHARDHKIMGATSPTHIDGAKNQAPTFSVTDTKNFLGFIVVKSSSSI